MFCVSFIMNKYTPSPDFSFNNCPTVSLPSYNSVTGEFMDPVLDSKYFGGKCEYVYNGEWRKFLYDSFCENLHYNEDEKNYRKPYNYHAYRFVVL